MKWGVGVIGITAFSVSFLDCLKVERGDAKAAFAVLGGGVSQDITRYLVTFDLKEVECVFFLCLPRKEQTK